MLIMDLLCSWKALLMGNYRIQRGTNIYNKILWVSLLQQDTLMCAIWQHCHLESNNLLPESQHGFRKSRSTMSAWSQIQQAWAKNTEDGKITGVLLWDLSAAFDCLDIDLLCQKLEIYGFDALY